MGVIKGNVLGRISGKFGDKSWTIAGRGSSDAFHSLMRAKC